MSTKPSPDKRDMQKRKRAAAQDAKSEDDGILREIEDAFSHFARPFVAGDSDLDNDDQADLALQRELNDEASRT